MILVYRGLLLHGIVVEEAVTQYRQQGGNISDPLLYGYDPLEGNDVLIQQKDELFSQRVEATPSNIFSDVLTDNAAPFEAAVMEFVSITEEFSS